MIQKTSPVRRWKQWLALPLVAVLFIVVASGRTAAQGGPEPVPNTVVLKKGTPPPPPQLVVTKTPDTPGKVYTYVDTMPSLPGGGGNSAIVTNIQSHLVAPKVAPADRKQGRVFVSFTVMKSGNVRDVRIIKGLADAYDAAVVAAVQQLPQFIPGTQNNKSVDVSFTVPIVFAE